MSNQHLAGEPGNESKKPPRTTIEVQFDTVAEVEAFKQFCKDRGMCFGKFAKVAIKKVMAEGFGS